MSEQEKGPAAPGELGSSPSGSPEVQPPSPPDDDSAKEPSPRRQKLTGWLWRAGVVLFGLVMFVGGWWIAAPGPGGHNHDGTTAGGDQGAKIWTCSMDPQIKLPGPGKCPICGMDLIPVDSGSKEDNDRTITLSERAKRLARIQTVPVRYSDTAVELKLLGRLEHDETRVRTITPWTGGRIDRLYVSNTGASVGPGQVIAQLYSPEVYTAHQDLISAKRQLSLASGAIKVAKTASQAAVESSRQRLLLLGVTKDEIKKMEKADAPFRHVKVRSTYGGTILELLVHEGAYVTAGTPMYRTADLSRLWVQLDTYEGDLPRIRLKQKVALRVESYPGEIFEGTVSFVDPVVDPRMRTAQVRVEVSNKKRRLRPGMFAEATLIAEEGRALEPSLVIPATAALYTGIRSVVYVQVPGKDKPTYEAREVQLGPRAGDVIPVLTGLQVGDEVVVRGAFMLDSDLQIRGGRSMMTMDDDVAREALKPIKVPAAFMKGFTPVLESYLELRKALSADDLPTSKKEFGNLAKRAEKFNPRIPKEAREEWKKVGIPLSRESRAGAKGETIEAVRRIFDSVSRKMIVLLQRFGNPTKQTVRLAFCPMAAGGKGAFWVQRPDKIENPYFGKEMYSCGEIRESIEKAARFSPHASRAKTKESRTAPAGGHKH